MKDHIRAKDALRLDEELQSSQYGHRVIQAMIDLTDPYQIYLYKEEVDSWLAQSNMVSHFMSETTSCQVFFPLIQSMDRAVKRYRDIMQEVFTNQTFLVSELTQIADLWSPSGPRTDKIREVPEGHPQNNFEQKVKLTWLLALRWASLKEASDPEGAINIAKRLLIEEKPKYDLGNEESQLSLIANAMLRALDIHSGYLDQKQFDELQQSITSGKPGVGVNYAVTEQGLLITKIIPGSAAELNGRLAPQDIIVAIDGQRMSELPSLEAFQDRLSGFSGTPVELEVQRPDTDEPFTVTIIRSEFNLASNRLNYELVEREGKTLAYVSILDFFKGGKATPGVAQEMSEMLAELNSTKNHPPIDGLLLDLRNNRGGVMSEAIKLVGQFVTQGPLLQLSDNSPQLTEVFDTDGGSLLWNRPMAILVNSQTTSAPEIVAGSLQYLKRALIIGDAPTFGKGTYQKLHLLTDAPADFPLMNGATVITEGYYYLPGGEPVQFKGIQPNFMLPPVENEGPGRSEHTINPQMPEPQPVDNLFAQWPNRWLYSRWESGARYNTAVKELRSIAHALPHNDSKQQALVVLSHWVDLQN